MKIVIYVTYEIKINVKIDKKSPERNAFYKWDFTLKYLFMSGVNFVHFRAKWIFLGYSITGTL